VPIGSVVEAELSHKSRVAQQAHIIIPEASVVAGEPRRRRFRGRLFGDRIFGLSTLGLALIVLGSIIVLAAVLIQASSPALRQFGLHFLISTDWDPVNDIYGALPFIYGTAISSALALAIAVPLSLGVALCLSELAPIWLKRPIAFLVELLAAIPSVVYGLWAIFVLGPWLRDHIDPILHGLLGFLPLFQGPRTSVGMFTAGVILAVMVIPYIASVCTDVFAVVPQSQREAALALGATKWEMVRLSVLPPSISGVVGAIILGLGRALGETIAVAMVIGNSPNISASLFAPAATLASVIANEFAEATTNLYQAALIELGLVLMAVAIVLNMMARLLVVGVQRRAGVR
ncbi:MAG TPA: phosphate ABC transporter permease subunit PstC, partial [Candidatus Binataceae bacterium]|nr:phosphate ABC transporter permease subunit PstC [Candidatus Binataceae bacterium]